MTPAPPSAVVVLVPDQRGIEAFDGLPGFEPILWDLSSPRPAGADRAQVLASRGVAPEIAAQMHTELPNLRMVQLFSAGRDGWTGIVPAGVVISGADRAHGGPVAEWVVAQLLNHYRDLVGYRAKQSAQSWERHPTGTLAGKRVLVLGAGDIGSNVQQRTVPFGADVTLAARTAREGVVDLVQARAMLHEQDVVVLALPLTADTHHMVDAPFLTAMRPGSVLVNAGRGPLVDTDALLAALEEQRIHAILDVTDPEPLPSGHPLWTAPGVVITPHSAAITDDTANRCWDAIVRNVSEFVTSASFV
ncbi:NAD(P)-dependent oxidoreductase [Rhodococcus sp. H29-C3]|uniref:NAD(P)-dependent oxidoreductase n=1 Tax=Rhodococcus sp. H29-C3 TaxID=3046307 RepID=UPI0024B914B2|nr:NAD(P)-dependent oxidoreductase [Rhodococcus sp. H29-C3]MDJ0359283.1 NAD(P)-dependent oxidoreductase [Rhodococcus sp. H29-C3]